MSIFTRQIIVSTKEFCDIVNITDKVRDVLKKSKIENGVVNVFAVGSTAGITTIEYEPNLIKDFLEEQLKKNPKDWLLNEKIHSPLPKLNHDDKFYLEGLIFLSIPENL